jgi:hypothetical protein
MKKKETVSSSSLIPYPSSLKKNEVAEGCDLFKARIMEECLGNC